MAKEKTSSPGWRLLLLLYAAVMFWLLFDRANGWTTGVPYTQQLQKNVNLTPLYTIKNYLSVLKNPHSRYMFVHCLINLVGNVVLFVPAGWLFPRVWPKMRNFFVYFAFCCGVIFLVETVQLFTLLGSFDVDDIILNLLGMTAGFLFRRTKRSK